MAQGGLIQAEQLRERLEETLGRELSADEWEACRRFQPQQAHVESSRVASGHVWQWTGGERAACLAALVMVFAGVSLLLQLDFVFSPFVRIPLGICTWLVIALFVPFLFVRLGWGFLWIFIIVTISFAEAGWALLSRDRDYLTSTHEWVASVAGKGDTPAELTGAWLVFVSILLIVVCRPVRSRRPS